MPFESPVLTHSRWRSHTISESRTLWVRGDTSCDAKLSRLLNESTSLAEGLRNMTGHFAAVVVGPEKAILIQDPIRSFPLFYSTVGNITRISDDVTVLAGQGAHYDADVDSRIEFRHGGYVAGPHTLYRDLSQVQAGECVSISASGEQSGEFYREFQYSGLNLQDRDTVDGHFTSALEATMSRFLEYANGRQLVVPLSGGLDSRLLSVHLKEAGYENVVNFSYGTGKTREVLISEQVAMSLDQAWIFCPYEEATIREAWDARETSNFISFAHAGASLPHIQDWYAVRWLKESGLVDDDAIFLPGHTIVGNMHDQDVLDSKQVSREDIKKLILHHHYSLQPENTFARSNGRLQETLDAFLDQVGYDGSVVSRLATLEYWNIRERQSKYINNSVRNYEFFGYEWALPMLDREMYLSWEDFHPSITRNRDWYEGYVNRRYHTSTGQDLRTFAPNNVPPKTREVVKSILGVLGLLRPVERVITAKAIQHHPMGFNWFVRGMSDAELFKFTRSGGNLLGAYADEFLTDSWNVHCHLFTPDVPFH